MMSQDVNGRVWGNLGFLGSSDLTESARNAGDLGSISGSGRSSGGGHGNPLQYSCLENPGLYPESSILLQNPEETGRLQSIGLQRIRHD